MRKLPQPTIPLLTRKEFHMRPAVRLLVLVITIIANLFLIAHIARADTPQRFRDGITYQPATEMPVGMYRSPGIKPGRTCQWWTTQHAGTTDYNNTIGPPGPVYAVITRDDISFRSEGCQNYWVLDPNWEYDYQIDWPVEKNRRN